MNTEKSKRIEDIMEYHFNWHTSKENAIAEIIWEVATNKEREMLECCSPSKELENRATELYNELKEKHYKELEKKNRAENRMTEQFKRNNKLRNLL